MSTLKSTEFSEPSSARLVLVRVLGHVLLALLIVSVPALGEERYLLAGFILLIAAPCVCWIGFRFKEPTHCWIDPLCDLTIIIITAWFMPIVWTGALCLALMVALSPSVSLHPRSNVIYACYGLLMLVGMGSAWLVRVPAIDGMISEGWALLAIAAVYPTLLVYANWQRQRSMVLLERSHLLTAVTDVSGGVAHDFNNVLMAISGHAELASLELKSDHPAQESLREVVDATSRASLLCGQLLAFSGSGKHGRETLNLSSELENIVGLLRPALPTGVSVAVHSDAPEICVYGERSEIQQVILNVIVNAGESMRLSGGTISVHIARSELNLSKCAVVTVKDTGTGIDSDALERVFDPFYTTKDRGHGLGLASVKRIMSAHAGEIMIESDVGVGTTVTLCWPETRVSTEGSAAMTPRDSSEVSQPSTVLS